ncbi:hypothetical protein ABFS82_09G085200 [Erythranthe guttata]|uniref:uncharacterized protein LOC105975935 n=1 Tax=Erythranthe guttata TaxID=4155 RepID=UPI00064DAC68|nr:PREDICTED: uncharacterized protein LOC105975935 [Erythranthe guttata]XP_012856639.1 PREDICTED: uncharacterized protein LOC105975935 [Erythranthe guttata]XP_012856641.1 PREDICTED: uncharacterized protein LOC105975935 [Erythranthe guttata]XP_012856642.1 PREDICTED: uncharacterized protein LOC105975935 [Erythranthe guttata]XP_012856643.1 PREDICTED: uncharacterized protein LOC105975935 [Erythranthe guttata]XP_012856644.1 PREDICTED: uncharacterized protein LOC105975935 [Erythranthe guttata]|eukprot:XP_012856638.1 PREDICTED: uncharacterized protein LOC105975935 [Erythranthe guttata]
MVSSSSSSLVFLEGEELKKNLVQAAEIRPCLRNYGEELIGCRVNIFTPVLYIHFAGTITSFNRLLSKHQVDYEAGGRDLLDLSDEIWELVDYENLSIGYIQEQGNTIRGSYPSANAFRNTGERSFEKKHMIAIGRVLTVSEKVPDMVYNRKSRSYLVHGLARHFFNTPSILQAWSKSPNTIKQRLLPGRSSNYAPDNIEEVFGYRVKASLAPILWFIFAKYGNFAANSLLSIYPSSNANLVEIVCDVVIKLIRDDFNYVLSELNNMAVLAEVAAIGQLDVSWLKKVLEEIDDVRKFTVRAATKDFDARKKVMMVARKRFKKIQRRFSDLEHIYQILRNDPSYI